MAQNQVDIEELSPLETLKYWMDFAPFHWWLKPEAYSVSEVGDIEVRLHFRPEFQRAPDAPEYHGGVVAALIDIVAHGGWPPRLICALITTELPLGHSTLREFLRSLGGQLLRSMSKCGARKRNCWQSAGVF